MARMVSGIDIAPLGAELLEAEFVAGAAAWGAAVAVFRFSIEAVKTAGPTRATTLHRIIAHPRCISRGLESYPRQKNPVTFRSNADTELLPEMFRLSYEKLSRSELMQMFYKS